MHYPILVATKSVEPEAILNEIWHLLGPYSEEGAPGVSCYEFVANDYGDARDPDTDERGWWSNEDCEFDYWQVEGDLWWDMLSVTDEGAIISPVTYQDDEEATPGAGCTWATSARIEAVASETWGRPYEALVAPGTGWCGRESAATMAKLAQTSGARALTVVDCHI